jgi:adenosylcobinamide kinase / adenosylcobinamide-phosphate guanylyltransferase
LRGQPRCRTAFPFHPPPLRLSGGRTICLALYAPPPTPSKAEILSQLTLVLGGARSGKSRHAEALLADCAPPRTYIATAQALDDEMRARITAHRVAREGAGWRTVEEPLDLAGALRPDPAAPILVDCLTLWLSNLLLGKHDLAQAFAGLDRALAARTGRTVLVSNEVGFGIVPENALARRFRDEAGWLHQRLAARADAVVFVVAGIPMRVK